MGSENLILDNFTYIKQDRNNKYSVVLPDGKSSKDLINEILKYTNIHSFKEKYLLWKRFLSKQYIIMDKIWYNHKREYSVRVRKILHYYDYYYLFYWG